MGSAAAGAPDGRRSLDVRVLGPLEVHVDGRPVEVGSKKQRILLLRLLVAGGRAVPVDTLVETLWGDDPPGAPDASLRSYASHLRSAIEPERGPRTSSMLERRADSYVLDLPDGSIDAERFESDVAAARTARDPDLRLARADRALAMWRGHPLADAAGLAFVHAPATRWQALRREASELRGAALLGLGRVAEAVAVGEEMVGEDPLAEAGWAHLMLSLYRSGRQADALTAYARARAVLRDELGVEPGQQLRELETRILDQSVGAGSWSRSVSQDDGARRGAEPLVGRDRQFAEVATMLEEVATGHQRVVVVSGEAGIGKTRLVESAVDHAGADVLPIRVRCEPETTPAGLLPLTSALREVIELVGPQAARELIDRDRRWLADLTPQAWSDDPDVPPLGAEDGSAGERFDALVRFLGRLADRRPLVLVVEDLHWGGDRLWELLGLLTARPSIGCIGLVVTVRPGEVPEAQLGRLAWLRGALTCRALDLDPLSSDEVIDLTTRLLGDRHAAGPVGEEIHRRSGGNPYFAVELIRSVDGDEPVGALERLDPPSTLQQVILARVAQLAGPSTELLTAAALIGPVFDLEVVARAARCDLGQAAAVAEDAIGRGLLVEADDRPGRLMFRHLLVREALASVLTMIRRAQWHAAVGQPLVGSSAADDPTRRAEIARHLARGALAGTALDAARWALLAIEVALAGHEADVAEHLAEQAIAALDHAEGEPEVRRRLAAELHCELSMARKRQVKVLESHAAARRAFELADDGDGFSVMIRAALCLAGGPSTSPWQGFWSPAAEVVPMLRHLLEADGDRLTDEQYVLVQNAIASNVSECGDYAAAWEATERSAARADRTGSPVLRAWVALERWRLADVDGSRATRRSIADEALAVATDGGFEIAEGFARRFRIVLALEDGRSDAAAGEIAELERLGRRERTGFVAFEAAVARIGADLLLGRLEAAEAGLAEALERFAHLDAGRLDSLEIQLVRLLYERHQMNTVEPDMRARLSIHDTVSWRAPLALMLAEHGRHDEVRELLDSIPESEFTTLPEPPLQYLTTALLAETVAEIGDTRRAEWLLPVLEPHRDRLVGMMDGLIFTGWGSLHLARLYGVLGRFTEAETAAASARRSAEMIDSPLMRLRAELALAEIRLRRGAEVDLEPLAAEAERRGYLGIGAWAARLSRLPADAC